MKGLSQPFHVLTDAETNADDKRFRDSLTSSVITRTFFSVSFYSL